MQKKFRRRSMSAPRRAHAKISRNPIASAMSSLRWALSSRIPRRARPGRLRDDCARGLVFNMTNYQHLVDSARLSRSLPPCGGGLGRGVATVGLQMRAPLPPMLRIVDLPYKGGGDKREG